MTCCCFTVCKREDFTGLPSKQLLAQGRTDDVVDLIQYEEQEQSCTCKIRLQLSLRELCIPRPSP